MKTFKKKCYIKTIDGIKYMIDESSNINKGSCVVYKSIVGWVCDVVVDISGCIISLKSGLEAYRHEMKPVIATTKPHTSYTACVRCDKGVYNSFAVREYNDLVVECKCVKTKGLVELSEYPLFKANENIADDDIINVFWEADEWTSIDPPSGWRYGFPKLIRTNEIGSKPLVEIVLEHGYPSDEVFKEMTFGVYKIHIEQLIMKEGFVKYKEL
jgi:hypothetical protein